MGIDEVEHTRIVNVKSRGVNRNSPHDAGRMIHVGISDLGFRIQGLARISPAPLLYPFDRSPFIFEPDDPVTSPQVLSLQHGMLIAVLGPATGH